MAEAGKSTKQTRDILPITDLSRLSPRVPTLRTVNGRYPKGAAIPYAKYALSSFNEKNRDQQGPEYELVDDRGCVFQPRACVFHLNFIARPKNGTEAENKLFFAELKFRTGEDYKCIVRCTICCILGPWDPEAHLEPVLTFSETGLHGCNLLCKHHPGVVQHPPDGGFTKVVNWNVWKGIEKEDTSSYVPFRFAT
ncbi:unnamed protein product [Cuscuta epithymum]|uniref:DUF3615 domain-containing protein n=1 Tax=Cuscuta epithymum TaxID=186058 RepID=A0AAV0CS83_9ASTE|nr:unnamed protein product [Cuscuta epithymum]